MEYKGIHLMELSAILKARAIARIDIDELNLNGRVRVADIVPALVAQYGFLKYPTKPEEFDLEKGVEFLSGKCGDRVIDMMTLYSGLITIETLSSTQDSKDCLMELLAWGRDNFGLTYTDGMIKRWAYISHVTFTTDFPLLVEVSSPLRSLGKKLTESVEDLFEEGMVFETSNISVGHDPLKRKSGIAPFSIQHRANFQFEDNKYFSEAPVQTAIHVKLLEELETDIRRMKK
jgi:hypothetical protein